MLRRALTPVFSLLILALATPTPAELVTQWIDYDHDGVALRGYLVYDDAQVSAGSPAPGVLVIHEWWGLNAYAKSRAEQLAGLGYVAFAADMYGVDETGEPKVTEDGAQASAWSSALYTDRPAFRARAAAALGVLRAQDVTDSDRLAAMGYCFGGTASAELAYSGADLDAVVSFHGSLNPPDEEDLPGIRASILICHGSADPLYPNAKLIEVLDQLEAGGADYRADLYGGAVHSFTNPKADGTFHPGVKYDADADAQSWAAMQAWFAAAFSR